MSRWIFLRGLTREARHWGDFPATFRARIPDAEVLAIDLPGNGCANGLRSPVSVEEMADWLRAEVAARGLEGPFYVLAMSLGAMVAIAWAEAHPRELAGCVLINTSLRNMNSFYQRLRPSNYPALARQLLPLGAHAKEAAILAMTSNLVGRRDEVLSAWAAWRRERPVSLANALRQIRAAASYDAPPVRPSVRMLVLAGSRDRLVAPRCSRRLAVRWRTAFAEHPLAGHDIPLDDGVWVAEQVRNWLP